MLVVSQDRRRFVNIDCIDCISIVEKPTGYCTIEYKGSNLGNYATGKAAEKALNNITDAYNCEVKRYYMPKE